MIIDMIRFEVKRQGWTQDELSAKTGIQQHRISEILAGRRDCFCETADKLMAVLGLVVVRSAPRGRRRFATSQRDA